MSIKKNKSASSKLRRAKKVFVATSGGIDSAVSLYLLKKAGYDVTAVFIKIGESIETPNQKKGLFVDSCWINERRDAMRITGFLNVPFITFDFEKEYQSQVLDYFFKEYKVGRTPNPDVMCNRKIKFPLFWKKARAMGADLMATGHYARVRQSDAGNSKFEARNTKQIQLLAGKDKDKDQSYFIYNLTEKELEYILFPIGHLKKSKVREIAKKAGLPNALKKESQGLCFLGHINVEEFLKTRIKPKPGKIVTVDGEVVGRHDGLYYYTIGQRRGIGIKGGGVPYFVVEKDMKNNSLIVAPQDREAEFDRDEIELEDLTWINGVPNLPLKCKARIRYRAPLENCTIHPFSKGKSALPPLPKGGLKGVLVKFSKPLRAVSPGQSVVFYKGERVLGGGIIK